MDIQSHLKQVLDFLERGQRFNHDLFLPLSRTCTTGNSLIPTESGLIHVALHVLLAHMVKDADLCSFQGRVIGFGCVVVDLSPGVFAVAMVHIRMASIIFG